MDERVQLLVQEYGAGRISRRGFLDSAARLVGAGTAAYLLVACAGEEPDNLAASPPRASAEATGEQVTGGIPAEVEMVELATEGGATPAFVARPVLSRTVPGVVVIQEWWGLNEHIKDVTRRLAQAGFLAIAPDLYRGEVAEEPSDARRLAMALVREQAMADIQAAVDYLVAQPQVEPKRIGVMGFCLGGGLAMMMAYKGRDVGATVIFYGGGVQPSDKELRAISAPLLGLYGGADQGIPVAQVREWERKLAEFGKTSEMVVYDGAPHAFFNDTRPSYTPEAAEDAWRRTVAWFQTYLV